MLFKGNFIYNYNIYKYKYFPFPFSYRKLLLQRVIILVLKWFIYSCCLFSHLTFNLLSILLDNPLVIPMGINKCFQL